MVDHRVLQVMIQILKDMGITEYEPRVINQMLEFTYSEFTDMFLYVNSWMDMKQFVCVVQTFLLWFHIVPQIHRWW